MKVLLVLAGVLFLATVVLVGVTAPDSPSLGFDRWQVVSDVSQQEMLDGHQPMMEQMRVSMTPQMLTRMRSNPMRIHLDSEIITLMEQNQAQIDWMPARR